MKKVLLPIFLFLFMLTGCNSMYVKPGTLDKNYTIFADRGGFTMKRSVKEKMEERGYKVIVGKETNSKTINGLTDDGFVNVDAANTMNARYVVKVSERREFFFPIWCTFNGFWWWNFNVSIADQKTGEEILSWRGRGCANSSLNKLDKVLNQLEVKND
ncbi:MAG: hypothetical protein JW974_00350 [Alphaproteobacteria bacterium]|nr:hypothetical protein [Alphaproteobacteria bacterium]MBN2675202.1 hypothetical protein [Alphaproteobacteria bacterium]